MNWLQAILLGILEGITEFLPISSTGHLIIASNLMSICDDEFISTFEIAIQLAAILSVVYIYKDLLFKGIDIYIKLAIAFFPIGVVGYLGYSFIKEYLFNPYVVSYSLMIGGIILVWLDSWSEKRQTVFASVEDLSYKQAFWIGCYQCFAVIPGVSRAAATIVGGMAIGYNKKQSAEFSFLLAIPTMLVVTVYDLYKSQHVLGGEQYILLAIGGIVSFIFAFFTVKLFLKFLERYGFKAFGYYRILLAVVILVLTYYGLIEMC